MLVAPAGPQSVSAAAGCRCSPGRSTHTGCRGHMGMRVTSSVVTPCRSAPDNRRYVNLTEMGLREPTASQPSDGATGPARSRRTPAGWTASCLPGCRWPLSVAVVVTGRTTMTAPSESGATWISHPDPSKLSVQVAVDQPYHVGCNRRRYIGPPGRVVADIRRLNTVPPAVIHRPGVEPMDGGMDVSGEPVSERHLEKRETAVEEGFAGLIAPLVPNFPRRVVGSEIQACRGTLRQTA